MVVVVFVPTHVRWVQNGQADAKFADADLSTKLKLLGVDVASFGGSSDFWFKRQYSSSGPWSLCEMCRFWGWKNV